VDRSLFRGRFLMGHLVVLALAGLFILAGFWQLDRLHQVRTRNAVVRSRMQAAALPLEQVLRPDAADTAGAAYRRVVVTGRYDTTRQVLIQFRTYGGNPGDYLMTPVVTPNGSVILVNRGWIPLSNTPVQQASGLEPPIGEVRITGILFPTERAGPRPTNAGPGLVQTPKIDLPGLAPRFDRSLYPVYLQLTSQDPRQGGDYPIVLRLPTLDDGPHLSYAIQWFSFTAVGLIGWPLLIRRSLKERARSSGGTDQSRPPPPWPRKSRSTSR
jgi:cytochrome oxidase assembly protein ShyY1